MRRAHKLLSLLLVLTLALGISAPVGAAYSDTSGHWAESSIDRWSAEGILNGKGGGGFDPDGSMTRAEFAQMLCNMMGYTEKAENSFADVSDDAWYADAILKLAAAGVISGVGGNMAAPGEPITREMASVMLCRAFGIKTGGSAAMGFDDAGSVSSWARDSVAALAGMGMINGVGDNKVAPKLNIDRASVAKLVDNMVAEYVTEDKTITGEVAGVVIVAGGATVTFEDATVNAPILVAPSAGGAKVELSGTTSAENVVVAAENAAVTVGESAAAESVTAAAPHAEVKVEGKVETVAVGGEGAKVAVSGAVGTVSTDAANTTVAVSGTVDKVDVAAGADKTEISTTGSAKIDSVTTSAEDVKVSGSGSVGAVTSEGGSANVTTKGTEVKNEGSGNVTAGGKPVEPGESATSSGGGSSGGGSSGGGGSSTHTHSWGEGTVTTAATCTAAGVKTFTCSCGETKTEPIDMLDHTPAAAYSSDPTGHWHACTVCREAVDKTAHDYGSITDCSLDATCGVCGYEKTGGEHVALDAGTVTTAATCTEAGEKTYHCSVCNGSTTEVIPAAGHTEVVDAAVEAACTTAGKTEGKHCSVCNEVLEAQKEVAALGHDFTGDYQSDAEGHWQACARCGEADTKAAHIWEDGKCKCGATKPETDDRDVWFELSSSGKELYLNWNGKGCEGFVLFNSLNWQSRNTAAERINVLPFIMYDSFSDDEDIFFTGDKTVEFTIGGYNSEEGDDLNYTIEARLEVSGEKPSFSIKGREDGAYDVILADGGESAIAYSYAVWPNGSDYVRPITATPKSVIRYSLAEGDKVQLQPYTKIEVADDGTAVITVAPASDWIILDEQNFTACETPDGATRVIDEDGLRNALCRGGEVILDADITLTDVEVGGAILSVLKPATLVLNGHTLTGRITGDWTELTIDGTVEGSTISEGDDEYGFVIESDGGTVTIKGGTYNGRIGAYFDGKVYIFSGTHNGSLYVQEPSSASPLTGEIYIYGGTFSADPTGYVNAGTHTVTDNGDGTWTVTAK